MGSSLSQLNRITIYMHNKTTRLAGGSFLMCGGFSDLAEGGNHFLVRTSLFYEIQQVPLLIYSTDDISATVLLQ